MLTRYQIGRRAIAFLDPPAEGPTSTQLQWVLSDINGGLTEVAHEAPAWLFSARRATGRLGGSTVLAVTATQDSEILTLATPGDWADRMLGCAVLVAGDPRVNRVEQLVTVAASGTITFGGIPADNETVTIGAITYRFKTAPAQAYDVERGADITTTRNNLLSAMRLDISASATGLPYWYAGTEVHPTVTGTAVGLHTILLTALTGGTAGNSLVLSEATATAISVSGATLTGGTQDQVRLTFPFAGTSGSVAATVYYESWALRSDEQDVTGPVLFARLCDGAATRLKAFGGGWEEWEEQQQPNSGFLASTGVPAFYRVEQNQSYQGSGTSRRFVTPTRWLRLSRWPSEPGSVSYTARLFVPQLSLRDITVDEGDARFFTGLPEGWDDMVLIPIVMWRMLAWLDFPETVQSAQESIRTGIHEKYKRALAFLRAQRAQTETTSEMSAG